MRGGVDRRSGCRGRSSKKGGGLNFGPWGGHSLSPEKFSTDKGQLRSPAPQPTDTDGNSVVSPPIRRPAKAEAVASAEESLLRWTICFRRAVSAAAIGRSREHDTYCKCMSPTLPRCKNRLAKGVLVGLQTSPNLAQWPQVQQAMGIPLLKAQICTLAGRVQDTGRSELPNFLWLPTRDKREIAPVAQNKVGREAGVRFCVLCVHSLRHSGFGFFFACFEQSACQDCQNHIKVHFRSCWATIAQLLGAVPSDCMQCGCTTLWGITLLAERG